MSKTKIERPMSWQYVANLDIDKCSLPETIEKMKALQKEHGKHTRILVDQLHGHTLLVIEAWKPVLTLDEELAAAKCATLAAYATKQ